MNKNEIEKLLAMDELELFNLLGEQGASGAIGFDPINKGKEIYKNVSAAIKDSVCRDPGIYATLNNEKNYDKVLLASSIADMIAALKLPISPFTVSVLCIKLGLENFCETYWNE